MDTKYLAILAVVIFSGCGADDDLSLPTLPSNPNTGVFLDSNVEGLDFSTNSINGTTNANGEFEYEDGETVTFSSYGQTLLFVPGHSVLTPFDNPDDTIHDHYTINILRFLQTLDTDGDPTNGITLPTVTGTMNLNFNQNTSDFENDANVINFITANTNVTVLTVSALDAINHFSTTLASVTNSYTLNLAGKTATSVVTPSRCTDGTTGGFTYTFTSTGFTMVGSDSITSTDPSLGPVTCTLGTSEIETFLWTEILALDPSFSISCGPDCTYSELNRMSTGVDIDGRNHITSVWHIPNSNVITEIKRHTDSTSPIDFNYVHSGKEVITIQ